MKILATVDGSKFSEVILPQLQMFAGLPEVEITLLSIAAEPHETARRLAIAEPMVAGIAAVGGTPMAIPPDQLEYAEDLGEAVERALAERRDYLRDVVARMPDGPAYKLDVAIARDPASAIIQYAMHYQPDMIVMGTHGSTGMIHRLFGDVAEQVVRAGVAPVLLVHPNARHARGADGA